MNTFKTLVLAGAISVSLSSCGQSSETQGNLTPSKEPTVATQFEWNDSAIIKSILSEDAIESWGYNKGTGKTSIDSFASDKLNLVNPDSVTVEPANCRIVSSMLWLSRDLNATHYAIQSHTEDYATLYKDFTVYFYYFANDSDASSKFDEIKDNVESCNSWSRLEDGNLTEIYLWNEPTQLEQKLISGTDGDGAANAFGINGSVIYSAQVLTTENKNSVEDTLSLAVAEINTLLDAAQK